MDTLTNSAIVVIAGRNIFNYVGECLASILSQDYSDLGIVFVNDASDDRTMEVVSDRLKNRKDVVIVNNVVRAGLIGSWKFAIRKVCSNPNSVIFLVDGDDYLTISTATSQMMECHKRYDVVWSQYASDNGYGGCCRALGQWKIRKGDWVSSHLMSFKKHLFDKIGDYYFNDIDGKPLAAAIDQAVMFTLLEMVGRKKCYFLDKVLYMYRMSNPLSWHNNPKTLAQQKKCSDVVRAKIPYNLSEGLSVVVVTHNDIDTIEHVLESFYYQSPPPLEVFVVDMNSTDKMFDLIKSIPVEKYPFEIRFYSVKDNFDFLAEGVEAKRILFTSGEYIFPFGSFTAHLELSELKLGRGMVKNLEKGALKYNPTINLRTLSGDSIYELVPSNFSVDTVLFRTVVRGCKDLLSEDFIKKLVSVGATSELLSSSVAYRIKSVLKPLPTTGPLGHLL
jgi:glycosyltransferase involved in cell wall biosynthesis